MFILIDLLYKYYFLTFLLVAWFIPIQYEIPALHHAVNVYSVQATMIIIHPPAIHNIFYFRQG